MTASPYPALFEPFTLGHLRLKNRIVSTSHAPAYAEDGMPGLRYQRYHEEKARGGLALTMFGGSSSVSKDSPPSFGQLQLGEDRVVPHLRSFARRIHAHDVGLICQLSHAGRRTRPTAGNWLPTVAPSPLREPAHGAMPKALEVAEIRRIVADYAAAARRCAEGGLDGVELLATGHLIGQFWSPLSNLRTDAYGGSFDNRIRFGLEVLEAIRAATPERFIVSLRFTANEFVEGGIDEEEGIAIAVAHARSGLIDCLNVSGGANWTKAGVAETVPSMAFASGRFVALAGKVRMATGLPVIHAAGVGDLATAHHAVAEGHVDLIGMTRAQIADPHLVAKHLAGEDGAIRPCVRAGFCIDRIYRGGDALCLHNPVTGREALLSHRLPASAHPLQAVIVGAGPAGLEAARTLAERGHSVRVLEALGDPGGQVVHAARIPWRRDMLGIVRWLHERCEALGVAFRFNCLAEPEDILSLAPDIVVLATGGLPQMATIPGAESHASTVWDALSGGISAEGRVLVYDETASQSGPTCAEHLAAAGAAVALVTPDRMIAEDVGVTNHAIHLRNLDEAGVEIRTDLRLVEVAPDGNRLLARFAHEYSARRLDEVFDRIVIDVGTVPDETLYEGLAAGAINAGQTDQDSLLAGRRQPSLDGVDGTAGRYALFRIGDCVSARGMHAAALDAARLCQPI
ncbi:MAG: FAD-dependent oxidoreductase [Pseudomonadota bacterium]